MERESIIVNGDGKIWVSSGNGEGSVYKEEEEESACE